MHGHPTCTKFLIYLYIFKYLIYLYYDIIYIKLISFNLVPTSARHLFRLVIWKKKINAHKKSFNCQYGLEMQPIQAMSNPNVQLPIMKNLLFFIIL